MSLTLSLSLSLSLALTLSLTLSLSLTLIVGFSTALGSTITGSRLGFLVIWIVGVGDTVSIGVGVFAIVGVVGVRIGIVRLAVTIGVGVVWIGSTRVFLRVGETVAIGIPVGISTVGW